MECKAFEYVLDIELEKTNFSQGLRDLIVFADQGKIICSFVYDYNNKTFAECGRYYLTSG